MGKKKGSSGDSGSKASAASAAEEERAGGAWAPLCVERRRLEEDWGRSEGRLREMLEAWRGALLGLWRWAC